MSSDRFWIGARVRSSDGHMQGEGTVTHILATHRLPFNVLWDDGGPTAETGRCIELVTAVRQGEGQDKDG